MTGGRGGAPAPSRQSSALRYAHHMTAVTTSWQSLPPEVDDPSALLDRSLVLLDALANEPVPSLRWYRSTATAIVLGRGQRRLHLPATNGPPIVERSTGGGAVLLDPGMLSLDVLLPAGHPWLLSNLGAVFLRAGEIWASALRELGVPGVAVHEDPSTTPRATDARTRMLRAICYATVGRGEVLAEGRKLVGLAQRRRRHGTLIQCGLLRSWRPQALLTALGGPADDAEITAAAVGLDELLDPPPTDAAVMHAVESAFATAGGTTTPPPTA